LDRVCLLEEKNGIVPSVPLKINPSLHNVKCVNVLEHRKKLKRKTEKS
jgi:hypothetical protein